MITRIYQKIAADGMNVDVETYAAWVRNELARLYPDAAITIETTQRESGVMPSDIEADTWEEEVDVQQEIDYLWHRYCQEH